MLIHEIRARRANGVSARIADRMVLREWIWHLMAYCALDMRRSESWNWTRRFNFTAMFWGLRKPVVTVQAGFS